MANFIKQSNWFKHNYTELELSPIEKNAGFVPQGKNIRMDKILLIIVVVIVVTAMGYWLYILLRSTGKR